jgi:DNA-binding NtrC family response regulator
MLDIRPQLASGTYRGTPSMIAYWRTNRASLFRAAIKGALRKNEGRVPETAEMLGVRETTLYRWLREDAKLAKLPRAARGPRVNGGPKRRRVA